MKIYLAGLHGDLKHLFVYKPKYVLESFYYLKKELITYINSEHCQDFLLDSGAFTFLNTGKNIDWNQYVSDYIKCINENNINNFFELDIYKIIGIKNTEILRRRIEKETGKKSIPVWHRHLGLKYLEKLSNEYDYIAFGGFAIKDITRKEYKYIPKLLEITTKNNCKVHGLGFTNQKELKKCKFYSVDSTTWMRARFGDLAIFTGSGIKIINDKTRRVNSKTSTTQNLKAWIEFQKYADDNL